MEVACEDDTSFRATIFVNFVDFVCCVVLCCVVLFLLCCFCCVVLCCVVLCCVVLCCVHNFRKGLFP